MIGKRTIAVALVAAVVGSMVGAGAVSMIGPSAGSEAGPGPVDRTGPDRSTSSWTGFDPGNDSTREDLAAADVERFDSKDDFRAYVQENAGSSSPYLAFGARRVVVETTADTVQRSEAAAAPDAGGDGDAAGGGASAPDRVSNTNVQEQGIDEPDILKTNGRVVFYAGSDRYDRYVPAGVTVLDANDPANPAVIGEVPRTGRMLLVEDTLVVLNGEGVYGYDVSDPEDPDRVWTKPLDGSIVSARLLDGQVYLVTANGIDFHEPCPVRPMGDEGPTIACTDVYYPTRGAQVDVTYTTMALDPGSGEVTDSVSVVGSRNHQATYVSENAVYVSYTRHASQFDLYSTFLLQNAADVLNDRTERRIRTLRDLNISDQAKQVELQVIVQQWYAGMDSERREELRKRLSEDYQAYLDDHKRDLVRTGLVKIGTEDGLSVDATGEVPGYALNQFSMDERDGRLRIATTVGRQWGGSPENDLYVLTEDLSIEGSVQGMAPEERIYSVRFVGETAYLVTFRQIDPFHVVDLSDPANPEELGNVELPGFSRYLHPLGEDRVLGIGQEDGKVKAVVFDVSTPSEPKVEDSLILDDRWSAVSQSHHAFLQDPKHGVFFLPGSEGGYVIDYTDGTLSVEKRVDTDGFARRAMYLNDYLYVFGENGVVVVDETDWTTVTKLDFDDRDRRVTPARPDIAPAAAR